MHDLGKQFEYAIVLVANVFDNALEQIKHGCHVAMILAQLGH
jgi:hypothetical protein